jgi:hypothetical protein
LAFSSELAGQALERLLFDQSVDLSGHSGAEQENAEQIALGENARGGVDAQILHTRRRRAHAGVPRKARQHLADHGFPAAFQQPDDRVVAIDRPPRRVVSRFDEPAVFGDQQPALLRRERPSDQIAHFLHQFIDRGDGTQNPRRVPDQRAHVRRFAAGKENTRKRLQRALRRRDAERDGQRGQHMRDVGMRQGRAPQQELGGLERGRVDPDQKDEHEPEGDDAPQRGLEIENPPLGDAVGDHAHAEHVGQRQEHPDFHVARQLRGHQEHDGQKQRSEPSEHDELDLRLANARQAGIVRDHVPQQRGQRRDEIEEQEREAGAVDRVSDGLPRGGQLGARQEEFCLDANGQRRERDDPADHAAKDRAPALPLHHDGQTDRIHHQRDHRARDGGLPDPEFQHVFRARRRSEEQAEEPVDRDRGGGEKDLVEEALPVRAEHRDAQHEVEQHGRQNGELKEVHGAGAFFAAITGFVVRGRKPKTA